MELAATVLKVLVMEADKSPVSTPKAEIKANWEGVVGDKHAGLTMSAGGGMSYYPRGTEVRNTRQVSLVSIDELEEIAEQLDIPAIQPEWVGANLLVEGVPQLTYLPPGTRFVFPEGTVLMIGGENKPCTSAGEAIQANYEGRKDISQAFPMVALGRRGVVGWVERPGSIRKGDEARVILPPKTRFPSLEEEE